MARHELTYPAQTTVYDLTGNHADSFKTKQRMLFETEISNYSGISRDDLPEFLGADIHTRGAA